MFRTFALSLAVSTTMAAPVPAQWEHPGYDAEDSYYNPAESVINAGTVAHLARRWSVALGRPDNNCPQTSAPLVVGDQVIVSNWQGIAAYATTTGTLAWRYNWPDPYSFGTARLAADGDVLIAAHSRCEAVSDPDSMITTLDVTTGRLRWRRATDTPVGTLLVDRHVLVFSGQSMSDELATYGIQLADGATLWHRDGVESSSVSAAGRILLRSQTTTSAADAATGTVRWTSPHRWRAEAATPASDRFLVSEGTTLSAVDATTGAVIWSAPGKAADLFAPDLIATDGRRVYRADGHTVEALSTATGRTLWSRRNTAPPTQPIRAGGLLYTGGLALNASSGRPAIRRAWLTGKQIITGGRLYTVLGNTLAAYAPQAG